MWWCCGLLRLTIDKLIGSDALFPGQTEPQPSKPKPVPRPSGGPLSFRVEELGKGFERDKSFVEIGRDGSGGGQINGHNIVLFSDTLVRGIGPLTCSIAYSDHRQPACLLDFGGGGVPKQGIPYIPEEQAYNDKGNCKTRVAIWPQVPGDRKRGIGVAPCSIQSLPGAHRPSGELYNTLYTISAGPIPKVERTVPKLWMAGEVLYGTYGTMLDPHDNMYYFFAVEQDGENPGIKVARASVQNYRNRHAWRFWNGSQWQPKPPPLKSAPPILDGVFSSGDIFWCEKYQTYLTVYFLHNVDSTFRYRYTLPNQNGKVSITGQWSDEYILYKSSHLCDGGYGFNYAGHAYPKHDPTGESLVLSCTLSNGLTPFFFRATME